MKRGRIFHLRILKYIGYGKRERYPINSNSLLWLRVMCLMILRKQQKSSQCTKTLSLPPTEMDSYNSKTNLLNLATMEIG